MLDIINIEWHKIRSYAAFWWVLGITAVSYPGLNLIMVSLYHRTLGTVKMPPEQARLMIGNPFSMHEVWHTAGYFSSWFIFIPAILVIMLMTNEYSFRTHRQNIIDGWNRTEFLTGKILDVALVTIFITLMYIATCLVIGINSTAAGEKMTENQAIFIVYFLLQTFSQLSIAFFIGFLLRNSFISLSVFLAAFLMVEPVLGRILKASGTDIAKFLPFQISNRLIPPPAFWGRLDPAAYLLSMSQAAWHVLYTMVFTTGLWIFCFWKNSKRDL